MPAHPGGAWRRGLGLWLLAGWPPAGVGLRDGTLKLWEVQSGKCLRTLEGHGDGVLACGFSPDGRLLVSGSWDRTLKLWEVQSGKCLRTLEGHGGGVWACGFSPDGRLLVSGSDDGTLKLWEVQQRQVPAHPGGAWRRGFGLWLLAGWPPAGVGL